MSVYAEIVAWSKDLPDWQRDALRRLTAGPVDDAQLAELEYLCLKPYDPTLPELPGVAAVPLEQADVPSSGTDTGDVALQAISDAHNVNVIAPASRTGFAPAGLTIVFGYSGAGKSGFTRILKRVCRARDCGAPIHPNVFQQPDGLPATATISFTAEGTTTDHPWTDGQVGPSALSRISIFDTGCAESYVTQENDVAYRPPGTAQGSAQTSQHPDVPCQLSG